MSFISYVLLIFIFMNRNEIKASKNKQKPFSMGCDCGKVPKDNEFVERQCNESARMESLHKEQDIIKSK